MYFYQYIFSLHSYFVGKGSCHIPARHRELRRGGQAWNSGPPWRDLARKGRYRFNSESKMKDFLTIHKITAFHEIKSI